MNRKKFDEFTDEILKEILKEENERKKINEIIIANGCPHIEKRKHIGLFSNVEFWECVVCHKQFNLSGKEIL